MWRIYTLAFVLLALTSCSEENADTATIQESEATDDTVFYVSLNEAIHQGQYDGVMQVRELKEQGSMGVGSTARLAEEIVLLDGIAYGIPADGKAYELPDTAQVAYAAAKAFELDEEMTISQAMGQEEVEAYLDSARKKNVFAAIKVSGRFPSIRYRSFHPQEKPYQSTDEVPNVVFTRSGIAGTMVGFFTPKSADVLNSPVYHFHFISEDKSTGGHVLDFTLADANVEIDYASQLKVQLPDPALLQNVDLNTAASE
ncbi:acetolactate decarboxylase [Pontibacter diazotrophicus]|uniref:Alpha-acetolactate decarboxylase n=1 Tax=Pontibacter diazotrophicus TaxID=1400979 RepID=A0A3D8LCB8_9BACT|nr:acetolactate decarboxylase [Pontibacter diazotrophicus]RDV15058.1 acetolactate decarboxylase [Pontibacter diazotrophicus]